MMHFKLINSILIITLVRLVEPSVESFQNDNKIQMQLVEDVVMLKTSITEVQADLNKLNSGLDSQNDAIRGVKSKLLTGRENVVEQCEMADFFQDIDVKMTKIKQKFLQVVNDNDDAHMDKIDEILTKVKKVSNDCSSDDNEALVALQNQITDKLSEFDKYMERLQQLEEKLSQPSNQVQQANPDLMNILNEINSKLSAQQEKLDKLDTLIPDMQNASLSLEAYKANRKAACNKKRCISQKILELTNNPPVSD